MRVTSSRPCRLRCIWLSRAGKQACQVRNKCHSWNVHIWPHYGCVFFFSTRAWNPSNQKAHLTKWTDMLHLRFWIRMIINHWGMLFLCADEKQWFLLLFSDSHGCGLLCTVQIIWHFLCSERLKTWRDLQEHNFHSVAQLENRAFLCPFLLLTLHTQTQTHSFSGM